MHVSRETFVAFLKANPELVDNPFVGNTISAMQYLDSNGKIRAQAIYSKSVQSPSVKVIPAYIICEGV